MMEYLIKWVADGIEISAVLVIAGGILYHAWRCLFQQEGQDKKAFVRVFREQIGRTMLLGLELLIAADIIRTVILEATLQNIMALGLLVLVRTFLSWSLELEIEGRWPWQSREEGK
jgi:uncharacterized membrane protein